MIRRPYIPLALGALLTVLLALFGAQSHSDRIIARLAEQADVAIAQAGGGSVKAHFISPSGWPSRHPLLSGGERLSDDVRERTAKAVAAIPGMGGIRWADGSTLASGGAELVRPLDCQDDVQALLRARTIRFEESSSRIDATSRELVGEVANALRPCLGSIIAISGHTDSSGTEPGNLTLSLERADAVRRALIDQGIPADGLRAQGHGSSKPIEGLEPEDPANRRIEFSVVESLAVRPTPVDTPAPR